MKHLIWLLILVGCGGQATTVRQDPHGGAIALEGAYMGAVSKARLMAAEHCGGQFKMLKSGKLLTYRCKEAKND